MTSKDPYEILGVSRSADQAEIKRAYRRLAKAHHPDRNPDDASAAQRFKEVQAAYEVLKDPRKRQQYDQFGAGGPRPDFHAWSQEQRGGFQKVHFDFGSMGDLSSIFEQFFSRGRRGGGRRAAARPATPGRDIEHDVNLTFDEAVRGTQREVILTSDGRNGDERIQFRVPAGVHDGQRIRLRGRGQAGPGGRGDLMVRCHVQPHPHFRRDGLDLSVELGISFLQAVRGARVEVPTPNGPMTVRVPPGTGGGTRLRLRALGIHDERSDKTGDLYAVLRIRVPRELSPRAAQLLDELEQELADAAPQQVDQ